MSVRGHKPASLDDIIGRTALERKQFVEQLEWPLQVLADNGLTFAFEHKMKIYERLTKYIRDADLGGEHDEDTLMADLLRDYECFCAFFFRVPIINPYTDEERLGALYPSMAQTELVRLIETHKTVIVLFSRQSGKSTTLSTYAVYYACGHQNTRLNLLAPTEDQLEVMKDVYHWVRKIPYLFDRFIGGAGECNKTKVKFNTGTEVNAKNINPNSGGDFRRGMRGTCFIDEWTLVSEQTIKEVLKPLQSNMYANVRLVYTGTPKLTYNPRAEQMADDARESDFMGHLRVSCWENIMLGATSQQAISDVFYDERIPCEFGKKGFCPRFWRNGGTFVPPDPEWADFQCDQVCYEYDGVVMEYFAEFPSQGSRVFPKQWILSSIDPEGRLPPQGHIPAPGRQRVMSIDLGFTGDPTAILVADPVFNPKSGRESLQVIGWKELKPENDMTLGTDIFRDRIQEMYHLYQPSIVFVDVTRNETFVENLYKTGNRIPRGKFFANETQKKKNSVGIYYSGPYKHEMVTNHRTQMQAGNWIVPGQPAEFATRWFNDHYNIIAKDTEDGRYKKYPNTGHTFDAAIMASLWLDGKGRGSKPFAGLVW